MPWPHAQALLGSVPFLAPIWCLGGGFGGGRSPGAFSYSGQGCLRMLGGILQSHSWQSFVATPLHATLRNARIAKSLTSRCPFVRKMNIGLRSSETCIQVRRMMLAAILECHRGGLRIPFLSPTEGGGAFQKNVPGCSSLSVQAQVSSYGKTPGSPGVHH